MQRMADQPPEALARVTLIVNTQRMRRRVTECLQTHGALLLPRILLVTEVARWPSLTLPRPISPCGGGCSFRSFWTSFLPPAPRISPAPRCTTCPTALPR
jgi:hypothetical protein